MLNTHIVESSDSESLFHMILHNYKISTS